MAATGLAQEENAGRHEGYYYPVPQSEETYTSSVPALEGVNRKSRVGLVAGLIKRQLERQYDPGFIILAKGLEAEKMIIIATQDGRYDTLYRLRALIAALTSEARFSPLLQNSGAPEDFNFLDLLKLGGFTELTLSNGRDIAHRIIVK
ncbi:MAG: hypothetical protein KDJ48_15305 [Nitratireductor sp.]|nr:hypothetical protein [Nitratireductor sp.]MCB1456555.1 hypothetical protein [Nitratireductor sp.]MCB1460600.1 hypothetical protein [Nitratireductor sp.]